MTSGPNLVASFIRPRSTSSCCVYSTLQSVLKVHDLTQLDSYIRRIRVCQHSVSHMHLPIGFVWCPFSEGAITYFNGVQTYRSLVPSLLHLCCVVAIGDKPLVRRHRTCETPLRRHRLLSINSISLRLVRSHDVRPPQRQRPTRIHIPVPRKATGRPSLRVHFPVSFIQLRTA